jgi:hypothetical protein
MQNCIKIKNGDNGNSENALERRNGKNILDLLPPQKTDFVVETRGFFRNRKQKVIAESITLTPSGDISIVLDSSKGQHMAISAGSWISFYTDK